MRTFVGQGDFECMYQPTCSEYAEEAVNKYGTGKGIWLATKDFSGVGLDQKVVMIRYHEVFFPMTDEYSMRILCYADSKAPHFLKVSSDSFSPLDDNPYFCLLVISKILPIQPPDRDLVVATSSSRISSALVTEVIDGDTIRLKLVRLLDILASTP